MGSDDQARCDACGSHRLCWFTPARWRRHLGIFLCLACSRINIWCPRPSRPDVLMGGRTFTRSLPWSRTALTSGVNTGPIAHLSEYRLDSREVR